MAASDCYGHACLRSAHQCGLPEPRFSPNRDHRPNPIPSWRLWRLFWWSGRPDDAGHLEYFRRRRDQGTKPDADVDGDCCKRSRCHCFRRRRGDCLVPMPAHVDGRASRRLGRCACWLEIASFRGPCPHDCARGGDNGAVFCPGRPRQSWMRAIRSSRRSTRTRSGERASRTS